MTKYKGRIHVHTVYEVIVEAPSQALAEEAIQDQIVQEDNGSWKENFYEGWTDLIDVEEATEEGILDTD